MLTELEKSSTLWKSYKGWGSTHPDRATFEEMYRSFKEISTDSVLTYGDLLPRKLDDKFFEEIKSLDSTNDTVYYEESSFRTVPLVKKWTNLKLKKISSNCNHSFAILDENNRQIRNIIPFDFSDTGLYNYTLTKVTGEEIPWGICDWIIDTNSSLLTFNNGVPEGVDSDNTPYLTFYQYVGPVGERHYIDAVLFDIADVVFKAGEPVTDLTEETKNFLDNIEKGFFDNHGFKGDDLNPGIGLQYNVLTNVVDSATNDYLKGYDDNSQAQVVQLSSHLKGTSETVKIVFVSEGVPEGELNFAIPDEPKTEAYSNKYIKIPLDEGFIVAEQTYGNHKAVIESENKIKSILLVKDDKTQDYELFYPREELKLTVKLPTFVDLIKLPPHLKLTSLSSYTDHITPQYYGPRTIDFVIASEDTVNNRSADFIVYNKKGFYLADALKAQEGRHVLLRCGTYDSSEEDIILEDGASVVGETKVATILKNLKIKLGNNVKIENLRFVDCEVEITGSATIYECDFENTQVTVDDTTPVCIIKGALGENLVNNGVIQLMNSTFTNMTSNGTINLFNTSVVEKCISNGTLRSNCSFIKSLKQNSGQLHLNGSRIDTLDVSVNVDKNSIIDTTNIGYVENIPDFIKLNSSYVVKYSENVKREIYPNEATIPFYTQFEHRVYAKLPDPFIYNSERNEIRLKLDTIEHTIFINENGELQCRFFSGDEIYLNKPDNIKTQIEDVYQEHADTVLDHKKPQNVGEAVLDLYWSKADLKNGKVPLSQLPDSVAYGGLQLVGMWQFEDSEGKYPTFKDCDLSFASDDEYTGLQNGWFFIVSASHKEDDPVYPQTSEDGVEWTAGDWIIYTGGKQHVIDFTKPLSFSIDGKVSTVYEQGESSIIYSLPVKQFRQKPGKDDSSDSDESSSSSGIIETFGTITVDSNGIITKVYNLSIETGVALKDVDGFRLLEAEYVQKSSGDSWSKLDRAYLDPVYSRLPDFAPVTNGENPAWSIVDGGTGLLKLSYKSLAEAIRLINETLLKLSPDRPASISDISLEIDQDKTTAKLRECIDVADGLQLNQLAQQRPILRYDSKTGSVYFKQTSSKPNLPLECCFYCGTSSDITVYDDKQDITKDCSVERFDPYAKYRLGFRTPTFIDAAEVTGRIKLDQGAYDREHKISIVQKNIQVSPYLTDLPEFLDGESHTLSFTEQRFYELNTAKIETCTDDMLNLRVLNNILQKNRTGGFGFLPNGTKITGTFIISDFIKYGVITPDAEIKLEASIADIDIPVEIETQTLQQTSVAEGMYDVSVGFTITIPEDIGYKHGTLSLKATASCYGQTITRTALSIRDMTTLNSKDLLNEKESGGNNLYPQFGDNAITEFGGEYVTKTTDYGLPYGANGYGWPMEPQYISYISQENPTYDKPDPSKGLTVDSNLYRFITIQKSFESIKDLCGFNVRFDWGKNKPELDPNTGLCTNMLLQICPRSNELEFNELLNGNKPVPVFFTAELKKDEACNHPGKSSEDVRRITFGRKPLPIKDIYIRVGIAKSSGVTIKNVEIEEDL